MGTRTKNSDFHGFPLYNEEKAVSALYDRNWEEGSRWVQQKPISSIMK
ncbi:hypothetical protein PAENIP36_37860 [Paenibacillus sp. P36]